MQEPDPLRCIRFPSLPATGDVNLDELMPAPIAGLLSLSSTSLNDAECVDVTHRREAVDCTPRRSGETRRDSAPMKTGSEAIDRSGGQRGCDKGCRARYGDQDAYPAARSGDGVASAVPIRVRSPRRSCFRPLERPRLISQVLGGTSTVQGSSTRIREGHDRRGAVDRVLGTC